MSTQDTVTVNTPSLPKGGGAIQSIGKGLGPVGTLGTATLEIPLPISSGRGFAPSLSLGYSSHAGNGFCGMGWGLSQGAICRQTRKGVPAYTDDDVFEGPDGETWMAERDADGSVERRPVSSLRGLDLRQRYDVARYQPRVKRNFDLIEHWRANPIDPGFWLIHASDGGLHLYGLNDSARITATEPDEPRVAQWLLQESMNTHGEHIVFEYKQEDDQGLTGASSRDHCTQRYVSRVCYGNASAHPHLYALDKDNAPEHWHFQLMFDYGERTRELTGQPAYEATSPWTLRSDPYSSYAYGFELRTLRLCQQVLMFHHFPDELGEEPVLVNRMLLEYRTTELGYSQLLAAHLQAYDASGRAESRPPMEFDYSDFSLADSHYHAFPRLAGLNDGQHYQLVDLYGEGLPGVLYRADKGWYYREPLRCESAETADEVTYGDWQELPCLPNADEGAATNQMLTDLTGDGRLDWVITQPGLQGLFTLRPDRSWTNFTPFGAFPREFFHPHGQLADLIGDGLSDLALIGTQSVRLYSANPHERRFDHANDIAHPHLDDSLPTLSNSQTEVVAFSDVLGSGQQHLVRIRHNEIRCWPNLGHGNFGRGFRLAKLPFAYGDFDASRILLADLDGSGACDLLYLTPDHVEIFMNRGGNGFEQVPHIQPWPEGVRYDRFCQVTTADLQGLGCASLVLTTPHDSPRHWRCDFITEKPYLLVETNNNMGASGKVVYRSSAQEWLDEKQHLLAEGKPTPCFVPSPVHLVSQQHQLDEITGNRLTQRLRYRQGYYDGHDRELRGFGLVLQTDSEAANGTEPSEHDCPPVLTKTWFHTGRFIDMPTDDHDRSDTQAQPLGDALLFDEHHAPINPADDSTRREMARALSGMTLRVETFGLDGSAKEALPYSVQHTRYAAVLQRPATAHQPHAIVRPLTVESVAYQYERQSDDPQCQHTLQLGWDAFDFPTHGVSVNYARRKTAQDDPPFEDPHEQTWWRDTHDPAQGFYHLNETRTEWLHHAQDDCLHLGLPYRQRSDAQVLDRTQLTPAQISHEQFCDPNGPLRPTAKRTLIGQSVQRYKRPLPADEELELGGSTHQALKGYAENAELDENALKVYEPVLSRSELEQRLHDDDYRKMAAFWPEDDSVLWSTCLGFVSYGPEEDFYLPVSVRAARSQGATTVEYDRYRCLPVAVTAADGCQTQADHDYRLMQPVRIVDANANTQEALYDGFGAMRASSYRGTELGKPAGFAPIADYRVTLTSPVEAIADPHAALQGAASAHFSDPFAWMGQVPQAMLDDSGWLARHVAQGDVLPDGHIRHSARDRLARDPQTREWLMQAKREPVFAASLQADRYPDDPESAQIRIALTSWDGFGRVLQTRQKVEPGDAHRTQSDGTLVMSDGQPQNAFSLSRWRVSERVEYNNKGLVIRVYRPFFADDPGYVDDTALNETAFFDQQFYDPLGRPTLTITAKGLWRRQRYLGWYSISEDENDTYEEAMQAKAAKAAKEREHIASAAFRTAGGRHIANEMATLHNKANANISSEPGKNALPPGVQEQRQTPGSHLDNPLTVAARPRLL